MICSNVLFDDCLDVWRGKFRTVVHTGKRAELAFSFFLSTLDTWIQNSVSRLNLQGSYDFSNTCHSTKVMLQQARNLQNEKR